MLVGRSSLDELVEFAWETLEEETDDANLGVCLLICEVKMRDSDETAFYTFCTDKRQWIQRAALQEGATSIEMGEVTDADAD